MNVNIDDMSKDDVPLDQMASYSRVCVGGVDDHTAHCQMYTSHRDMYCTLSSGTHLSHTSSVCRRMLGVHTE